MAFGRKHFRRFITGKQAFQGFFTGLRELSLRGLNIGCGDNVSNSGEKNVLSLLAGHMPPDAHPVIFDVGANTGLYTQEALSVFGSRAAVYCFEPLKKAYTTLAEAMKPHPNVRVFNIGFGATAGTVPIYANEAGSPLGSCYPRKISHLGVTMTHTEEISVDTLDDFCRTQKIGHIDLLKADVEGGELAVLEGGRKLIESGAIDHIQFEFGPCDIDSRTFFKDFYLLLEEHYRLYRVLTDGFALIDRYSETLETFLTTNYLAIARSIPLKEAHEKDM